MLQHSAGGITSGNIWAGHPNCSKICTIHVFIGAQKLFAECFFPLILLKDHFLQAQYELGSNRYVS
jgi:hypothetical protein